MSDPPRYRIFQFPEGHPVPPPTPPRLTWMGVLCALIRLFAPPAIEAGKLFWTAAALALGALLLKGIITLSLQDALRQAGITSGTPATPTVAEVAVTPQPPVTERVRDPPAGRGERTIMVRKGETLSIIAARHMPGGDSAENIARLRARNRYRLADWEGRCENHLRRPGVCEDVVFAGGRLVIPASRRR